MRAEDSTEPPTPATIAAAKPKRWRASLTQEERISALETEVEQLRKTARGADGLLALVLGLVAAKAEITVNNTLNMDDLTSLPDGDKDWLKSVYDSIKSGNSASL